MKKNVLALVMVLSLVLTGVIYAQGSGVTGIQALPGTGWWSSEALQNVGTGQAEVIGTAYDMDSTATYTTGSFTITQGSAVSILPSEFNAAPVFVGMSGHRGSAVFASSQSLVATVNMTNRFVQAAGGSVGVNGGYAAGVYEGTGGESTGTQLNFPIAKNDSGNKDTTYFVQNAGDAAAIIYATFFNASGTAVATWNSSAAVAAGQGVMINSDPLPAGTQGSAVVTSTVPLAGVYTEHEYQGFTSAGQVLKTTKAFVPADGDDVLYAPAYKKGYGAAGKERSSAIAVQAQADGVSGVIAYTCASAGCANVTVNFGPLNQGQTYVAWPYSADHSTMLAGFYSAKITATGGNIVATVSETGWAAAGQTTFPNRDTTYSAIPEHAAATRWSCPVVKERYFQNAGSAVVFNTTGAAITTDVAYTVVGSGDGTNIGNTYTIDNYAIPANASVAFFDVSYGGLTGITWVGGNVLPTPSNGINAAVVIEASAPVVVTSNENVHYLQTLQQDAKQYSCFPIP